MNETSHQFLKDLDPLGNADAADIGSANRRPTARKLPTAQRPVATLRHPTARTAFRLPKLTALRYSILPVRSGEFHHCPRAVTDIEYWCCPRCGSSAYDFPQKMEPHSKIAADIKFPGVRQNPQVSAEQIAATDAEVLGSGRRNPAASRDGRDPETYAVIGAAMEVHREFGPGFLEGVYHDAMQIEFTARGIPFARECPVPVTYKGVVLGTPYRADFICHGTVLVELKAIKALSGLEEAQVIHYLKATGLTRALLINFGAPQLEYKRLVRTPSTKAPAAI
jgi:GxxExxY protein